MSRYQRVRHLITAVACSGGGRPEGALGRPSGRLDRLGEGEPGGGGESERSWSRDELVRAAEDGWLSDSLILFSKLG